MKTLILLMLCMVLFLTANIMGQTIWNDGFITFTKADYADHTRAANQDRITSNVWITRKTLQGVFNIKTESGYNNNVSPADTEWALGTTATYSSLTYRTWANWHGQEAGNWIVGKDAVVHLITDDIYIDIKFTAWTKKQQGGGFTYERATEYTLPVELAYFSAAQEGRFILLNWRTESEFDHLGFIVERSPADDFWTILADYNYVPSLVGRGNTSNPRDYEYTDEAVEPGSRYAYRLADVATTGEITYHAPVEITLDALPEMTSIRGVFPNPFNPETHIDYQLAEDAVVRLGVYDVTGHEVRELVNEWKTAGNYQYYWNGKNANGERVQSGTYFLLLESGGDRHVKKVVLMK